MLLFAYFMWNTHVFGIAKASELAIDILHDLSGFFLFNFYDVLFLIERTKIYSSLQRHQKLVWIVMNVK